MPARTEYLPLRGGTANHGRVVKVGDEVHRPTGPWSPNVHALLRHLRRVGFAGSPEVLRDDGPVEVLGYIEGDAATEPLPGWALTTDALVSVGRLLRELHRHAAGFDGRGLRWQRRVPARWRGSLVTHNDVNPANVIFRDGRAVALIDFDLAAPGTPAWELAGAACFWAPLRSEADVDDERKGQAIARFRALLEGYEAPADLRAAVAEACAEANEWIAGVIYDASRRGHPAFGRLWAEKSQMYTRSADWMCRNRARLLAAAR